MKIDLKERAAPMLADAAAAIYVVITTLVNDITELVPVLVREHLEATLAGLDPKEEIRVSKPKRRKHRAKPRASISRKKRASDGAVRGGSRAVDRSGDPKGAPDRAATATTTKGTPRSRAVMKCGLCGELGKRKDSCGKTHNVKAADRNAPLVVDRERFLDATRNTEPPQSLGQVRANPGRCSSASRGRRVMTKRSLPWSSLS